MTSEATFRNIPQTCISVNKLPLVFLELDSKQNKVQCTKWTQGLARVLKPGVSKRK